MRDVSARERDYEELMEHSSSAMFCVDTEGRITGWNTAMERISGVAQQSVTGLPLRGEVLGPSGVLMHVPHGNSADAMTELDALLVNVLALDSKPVLPSTATPELLANGQKEDGHEAACQEVKGIEKNPSSSDSAQPPEAAPLPGGMHPSNPSINVRFVKASHNRPHSEASMQVRQPARKCELFFTIHLQL